MIAYIIRRIVQSIIVVLGVTIIVFVIVHLLPGGPRALLGPRVSPAVIHAFIVANGYNHPIYIQYIDYLGNLLQGKLGYSYTYNEPVLTLLARNLPKSALLVGLAYAFALVIAIPLGMLQALRRNKPSDYVLTGGSFIGYSMPVFWLGLILIEIFAVQLHLFPPEGPQGATVGAVISQPSALVLPVATLAIVTVALFSRYMRSAAIENLVQDYIRTARAKGASQFRIVFRHLARNSLIPIITLIWAQPPRNTVRSCRHRVSVQLSGNGPAVLDVGDDPRFSCDAGIHGGRRNRHGGGFAYCGHHVRRCRPSGPILMTGAGGSQGTRSLVPLRKKG